MGTPICKTILSIAFTKSGNEFTPPDKGFGRVLEPIPWLDEPGATTVEFAKATELGIMKNRKYATLTSALLQIVLGANLLNVFFIILLK